jgi:hypothetical protein
MVLFNQSLKKAIARHQLLNQHSEMMLEASHVYNIEYRL